ncbi:hypothetical protein ACFOY4_33610 [Actinomadura syzygii]|uniref:Uncharacterized protein n=1 Tax=Actinomadura syzygii TaxID=1427538 RepID=A0A5D0UBN5_9ACTN|nr:hypothetical protein [Actinomadura syzygii]TYC15003.1 hypothetical protein FXF65_12800 [Actinomadura syzygii]
MSADENAPGDESGGAEDEQAGGRVVESTIPRYPVAHVSVYAPAGRRRWWWYAMRCPHCGAGHFGRARSQDGVKGTRRTGCGRRVWVIVARTYGAREAA